MTTKKEPQTYLGKLKNRLNLAYKMLIMTDLRTVLACKTLIDDYSHATNKIQLGSSLTTPWYTYPFLEHLVCCNLTDLRVFEFGGGNSTKFWVNKCKKVITVEKDRRWFSFIKDNNKDANNLVCLFRESFTEYTESIKEFSDELFDVIVIDGHWRKACAETSLNVLSSNGCIVIDNSDWCPESCSFLKEQGFARIDFGGFGSSNQFTWTTSLFFKSISSPLLNPEKHPQTLGYIQYNDATYMFKGENA